jgi:hypothetical protein
LNDLRRHSHFAHLTIQTASGKTVSRSDGITPEKGFTRIDVFNQLLYGLVVEPSDLENYVVLFFAVDPMKI